MIKRKMPFVHPGKLLRSELIVERKLTITKIASLLKVSRQAISAILNERAAISPEMALRIATVFGGNPDIWLRIQVKYDLALAAKKMKGYKLVPYMEKNQ